MKKIIPKSQIPTSKKHSKSDFILDTILNEQGVVLLDGGLATELEKRGWDLNHRLWSAKLLMTHPEAIRDVHLAYLAAGADCIISSTYQASIEGFVTEGASLKDAKNLLKKSVELAISARDQFVSQSGFEVNRCVPVVAASIGPYGAYLADGSEYSGRYGLTFDELMAFHEERWHLLAETPCDLLACETIPSFTEAMALLELFKQTPDRRGWISFTCPDDLHISDGTPFTECAAMIQDSEQVVGMGVNCSAPWLISPLIRRIRETAPSKQIVVYPNSGEVYDGRSKQWQGHVSPIDFGRSAVEWKKLGATIIGGCCRTGPEHIQSMRLSLLSDERAFW